jgi:small-conductance mechanosensitive channel
LIEAIKEEVEASCPRLNTETRSFRVHWREFENDHLGLTVDAKFNLPPTGDVYWDNRQEVLLAVARAAERNDVEFALPTVQVNSGESTEKALGNYRFPSDAVTGPDDGARP